VLLSLSTLGTTFILYSLVSTKNFKSLKLENISQIVDFETEKVNKAIKEIEQFAILLVYGSQIGYDLYSKESAEEIALKFFRSNTTLIGGGFWYIPFGYSNDLYREGIYVFYDKEINDIRIDYSLFGEDYDYHTQNWYIELSESIKEPNQVIWTSPYYDQSGSFALMTTAGAGYFDNNGILKAISTVDWEIEFVVRELSSIKPTPNSFVLLSDPKKNIIISSTMQNFNQLSSLSLIPWDVNSSKIFFQGKQYSSFHKKMDNGWLMTVQIPITEIFEEIENRNNKYTLIIFITSLLILLLTYFMISRFVSTPIGNLMKSVNLLAEGNLETKIEAISHDELGLLASTFNHMTLRLRETIEDNIKERSDKDRINTELHVAARIQKSMLPSLFPPFPDRPEVEIYALMVAAREVGGDFYDYFFINQDTLAVVIADVSGIGIPAALFMVRAKTLIKNNALSGLMPNEVFKVVNNLLLESNEESMFVTAMLGYLNLKTGNLIFVNAGHNPPLLKHNKRFEWIRTKPDFVLAGFENTIYHQHEITLSNNDELFLYTDGVTEASNYNNELFSEQRLYNIVNNLGYYKNSDFCKIIKEEIDLFTNGIEQTDDTTILSLKFKKLLQKELNIQPKVEFLEKIIGFLNDELNTNDIPAKIKNNICLAVEEVFVNIVNYSKASDDTIVSITLKIKDDIEIVIEDNGLPFNPIDNPDPEILKNIDAKLVGNLGIYIVKSIMDSIVYQYVENKNILILKKRY